MDFPLVFILNFFMVLNEIIEAKNISRFKIDSNFNLHFISDNTRLSSSFSSC